MSSVVHTIHELLNPLNELVMIRKYRNFLFLFILILFFSLNLEALSVEDVPIIPVSKNSIHKRKCKLSICAIFRDEAPFLKEWIEYHMLVGVSHFYLYNNLSQDNYREVLQPYIKTGVVELYDVPFESYAFEVVAKAHNFAQVCCYNHAINLAKGFSKWLAVIDLDEFICPVQDPTLTDALERYSDAAGLVVYWQIYGPSNVWDLKPGELLIEKLLYKEPLIANALFKSIVRPENAVCIDPHWCMTPGKRFVDPNNKGFSHTPGYSELPIDILRINHYTYRTESYYYNFKKPRRERWGEHPNEEYSRARFDHCNTVYDPIMLRFVPKLRKRMELSPK